MRCLHSLALAALLLVGCSDRPRVWGIDPSFSDEETAALERRFAAWNGILRPSLKFRFARRASDVDGWVRREPPPNIGMCGQFNDRENVIRIAMGRDGCDFEASFGHELGHAVDLDHVGSGVMRPSGASLEFSTDDINECRDAGACP